MGAKVMAREWLRTARVVAGWLPAGLWLAYGVWNTVWVEPPRLGPITPINLFYVAMLPAAVVAVAKGRRAAWPGQLPYAAFLAVVVISLAWAPPGPEVEVVKTLLIYGLLGLTAAQLGIGARAALPTFVASLIVLGIGLSLWTIGHAVSSGFRYRAGLPINPNLPAMLIAPGLIAAFTMSLQRRTSAISALAIIGCLICLYACLLLGSRGVLVALVPALAIVVWRQRPALARAFILTAGIIGVVALARTPAVPYAIWVRSPAIVAPMTKEAPPPLATDAVTSNALSRFREPGVGTFNLRRELWLTCFQFSTSGIGPLIIGGGMGMSDKIVHAKASGLEGVFGDSHHAWLHLLVDFGLVGVVLFSWMFWCVARELWRCDDWLASAGLGMLVFWAVAGLTATVTDLHVFWINIGAAAAGARLLGRKPAVDRLSPQ